MLYIEIHSVFKMPQIIIRVTTFLLVCLVPYIEVQTGRKKLVKMHDKYKCFFFYIGMETVDPPQVISIIKQKPVFLFYYAMLHCLGLLNNNNCCLHHWDC